MYIGWGSLGRREREKDAGASPPFISASDPGVQALRRLQPAQSPAPAPLLKTPPP